MMCQTAPQGEPHFVNTMLEHTTMCGQMARAFGNDRFELPAPFPEVLYVVENHDRGWDTYDRNPAIDPDTRLPYIMVKTPIPDLVKTNRGSPDFNEAHNPYCGLLSSMHTVGLYNGRYGFSKFIARTQTTTSIDVADTQRTMIDAMLANEQHAPDRAQVDTPANGRRRGIGSPIPTCSRTTSSCSSSTPCRSTSICAMRTTAACKNMCTCR